MALSVEIAQIKKSQLGKTKALVDLKFGGCLLVKGFSVMEGANGIFVSMPRKSTRDGKWFSTVSPEADLQRQIEGLVLEAYDKQIAV